MAKTGIKNGNYNLLESENQSDLGVLYDCAPILVVFAVPCVCCCKDIGHHGVKKHMRDLSAGVTHHSNFY